MLSFRTLAAALSVGALLTLSACSSAEESVRDADGNITESNDKASVFDMKIGDCHNFPANEEAEEFETLPAVPCSDDHDLEVYAIDTVEGDDFPGLAAVEDRAMTFCEEEFETFANFSYMESQLDFTYLTPTEDSWDLNDDREITCLIGDIEGPTTGTLKDAGR